MIKTTICDLFNIEYPVFQGGMAWLGTAELASAVSEGGGLGFIGAGNAPAEWVRQQIQNTRARTSRPFGVNVMLLSPYAKEVIQVVLEERVPVVATGAGNPGSWVPLFKERGIKVIPVVASVALARRLEKAGVDALVVEGIESGGHVGEITTLALVPQVVDSVGLPIVAAGGIGDGRGMAAALALGAQGVQLGTRFICCAECVAHPHFKEKILNARDRATVVTGHTTGHPVRALENKMTRQFAAMEKAGALVSELEAFGTGKLRLGVIEGDLENGSLMAGQVAGLIKDIKPARDIIREIVAEAEAVIRHLHVLGLSGVRA
ncbi:MAG: enoyl-[acyl-carrier-protein] reductase FabK [Chloroflexi bacterium]|nr:enoyl-[acyl-carrier-protein] reductase FabK [Chloroflexota bacterium]